MTTATWAKLLDLTERAGWTFIQSLAGSIAAAGAVTAGQINWPMALAAAVVAAIICVLKVLGVSASQTVSTLLALAAQQKATTAAERLPQHLAK